MKHIYTTEYMITNIKHDYWLCDMTDCYHCIKNVFYNQEVTGKEKEHVIECLAGME